jgi:hypothetical protein
MMMLSITGLQHISLALGVFILLGLAPARWLLSYGIAWLVLFLAGALGQLLLGIMKSNLAPADMAWSAVGTTTGLLAVFARTAFRPEAHCTKPLSGLLMKRVAESLRDSFISRRLRIG